MVKYGKRKKRPVLTPPRKLPPPKRIPGGIQQRPYKAEKPEGVPPKHEIPASEIPKGKGVLLHPSTAVIKEGAPDEVAKKIARKNNLIAAAIAIPIVLGVVLLTPYIIWGHAWWEHPWGFGGGGGGGGSFDGTYYATVTTVTPIETRTIYGTFTVVNGSVSDPYGTFTGTVDANGNFTGTTIVSQGSPSMAITGRFSLTRTFTLSGSSGNTSQTIVAYKI